MDETKHLALDVTDATYEAEIKGHQGVVLVDFWAAWCGPCHVMAPHIEAIAEKYKDNDQVKVAKVDVDANTAIAQTEMVMSLPTFKVFVNGEPVEMAIGVQPKENLEQLIEKHLKA